jgi:hypothetical protein
MVISHQADGIALAIQVVILTFNAHHHTRRQAGVQHGGNVDDDARQWVSFAPTKRRRARVPAVVDAALCARDPSLHWHGVRVQRVLAAPFAGNRDQGADRLQGNDVCAGDHHVDVRLAGQRPDVDVQPFFRGARRVGGGLGWLAGACGATQGGCCCRMLLGRRDRNRRGRCIATSTLVAMARNRVDRRNWTGTGLHLARLHAHQMVSRREWRSWGSVAGHLSVRRWLACS